MQHFLEILEYFSRVHNRKLDLFEAAAYTTDKGDVLYRIGSQRSAGNITKDPQALAALQNNLKAAGFQGDIKAVMSQAPEGEENALELARTQKTATGGDKPIKIWKSVGSEGGTKPKQDQSDEKQKEKMSFPKRIILQGYESFKLFVDQVLAERSLQSFLPSLISSISNMNKLSDSAKLALKNILVQVGCEDIKNIEKCINFEQFQLMIRDELFGSGKASLANRIYESSVVVMKDGKIDTESRLTPKEVAINVNRLTSKLLGLLEKPELDEDDVTFIRENIKWFGAGGGQKIMFTSEDGTFRISYGNKGMVEIFSRTLLERFKETSKKTASPIENFEKQESSPESFSAELGGAIERLTSLRVQSKKLKQLADDCALLAKDDEDKAKLCSELNLKYDEIKRSYAIVATKLTIDCQKLSEFGFDIDLIGSTTAVQIIENFREEIYQEIRKNYPNLNIENLEDSEKIKLIYENAMRVANFSTVMIERQPAVDLADWSSMVGSKRGAGRKSDLLLFYFDEDTAKKAEDSLRSEEIESEYPIFQSTRYQTYDLNSPELANLFFKGKQDKEYELLLQRLKSEGLTKLYIIKPSLKATSKSGQSTKTSTSSGKNTSNLFEYLNDKMSPEDYMRSISENIGNFGTLYPEEAKELYDTTHSLVQAAGMTEAQAREALEEAYKWNRPFSLIAGMTTSQLTTTLGGTQVESNSLIVVSEMLEDLAKRFSPSDTVNSLLGTDLSKEVTSLIRSAKSRFSKGDPVSEKVAKEYLMKALNVIQNAKRKKLLESKDPKVRDLQRRALAAEIQVRAGAAQRDLIVFGSNFEGGYSTSYLQNLISLRHAKDVMSGNFTINVNMGGCSIISTNPESPNALLNFYADFSGKANSGGSFETRHNQASMNLGKIQRYDVRTSKGVEKPSASRTKSL